MNVNTDQAAALAAFLDTADDYLGGGLQREHPPFSAPAEPAGFFAEAAGIIPKDGNASSTGAAENSRPAGTLENGPAAPENDSLEGIALEIEGCGRCALCQSRTKTASGEGVSRPLVMVIGEGPGKDEDATGRPFVGRAGQLLDRMLDSKGQIGLSRTKNCYIANILKCRAAQRENGIVRDRRPSPAEIAACLPFLIRQIRLLKPRLILAAGNTAAQALLGSTEGITRLRGKFTTWTGGGEFNIPLLPTFHPSALLRDEGLKAPAWEDMKLLREKLRELDGNYAAASMPNI